MTAGLKEVARFAGGMYAGERATSIGVGIGVAERVRVVVIRSRLLVA